MTLTEVKKKMNPVKQPPLFTSEPEPLFGYFEDDQSAGVVGGSNIMATSPVFIPTDDPTCKAAKKGKVYYKDGKLVREGLVYAEGMWKGLTIPNTPPGTPADKPRLDLETGIDIRPPLPPPNTVQNEMGIATNVIQQQTPGMPAIVDSPPVQQIDQSDVTAAEGRPTPKGEERVPSPPPVVPIGDIPSDNIPTKSKTTQFGAEMIGGTGEMGEPFPTTPTGPVPGCMNAVGADSPQNKMALLWSMFQMLLQKFFGNGGGPPDGTVPPIAGVNAPMPMPQQNMPAAMVQGENPGAAPPNPAIGDSGDGERAAQKEEEEADKEEEEPEPSYTAESTLVVNFDEKGNKREVTKGKLITKGGADNFRNRITPTIPQNFQRQSQSFHQSDDGKTLEFCFVDVEQKAAIK